MTAPVQVLPTATPAAFESGEVVPALTGASAAANTAIGGRHVVEAGTVHTAAVDAVRETLEAAERAQQTGRNHVELRLQTSDTESLRVHLRLQDGVVHAKFVTETTELQHALAREWDLLTPRLAERGIKFGETSFENRDQSGQSMAQNAFTSGQQRQQSHGQHKGRAEDFVSFLSTPAASTTAASRRSSAAAPASAAIPTTPSNAEARGLRVWA